MNLLLGWAAGVTYGLILSLILTFIVCVDIDNSSAILIMAFLGVVNALWTAFLKQSI